MQKRKVFRAFFLAVFAAFCLTASSLNIYAQSSAATQTETVEDDINLDTQLYMIVGTNQDVADAKLPAALDPVLKQLRSTLPFKNYRLAATLINRIKNGGGLNTRWIGGPFEGSPTAEAEAKSSNNHLQIRLVKLYQSTEGQPRVQVQGFSFNARVPVPSIAVATTGNAIPTFNYETTALATDISMAESNPVIVGTLNIGPSGDAIILVVSVKRTER